MSTIPIIDKEWSNSVEKLIAMIQSAGNALYGPIYTFFMGKAMASQVASMDEAITKAKNDVRYENGELTITKTQGPASGQANSITGLLDIHDNGPGNNPLKNQIISKIAHEEASKAQNLDHIINRAHELLSDRESYKDKRLETEWMLRFLNLGQYIFTDSLREIWARVLAAKVLDSDAFSIRSLEALNNLSPAEIDLFQKIIPLVFVRDRDHFLWGSNELLREHGVTYRSILLLDECRLIQATDMGLKFQNDENSAYAQCFHNGKQLVRFDLHDSESTLNYRQYPLTSAGRELYSILYTAPSKSFLHALIQDIQADPKAVGTKITVFDYLGDGPSFVHSNHRPAVFHAGLLPTRQDPIDINHAAENELAAIPGINRSIAKKIIDYRNENNRIHDISELNTIDGIGKKRFANLSAYTKVTEDTI